MLKGLLLGEGYNVGGLQVRNLMKRMGIQAMYRRPNTSKPAPSHKIYPYLFLSKIPVMRPNQVSLTGMKHTLPGNRAMDYLHSHEAWFCLSGCRYRLVHPSSFILEAFHYPGVRLLH